jgi:predicted protein tyrosine phosphatase
MQWILPIYLRQPPVWFYPRILVGAGEMLTPSFMRKHNITHVINCAQESDSPDWFKQTFPARYICLDAHDSLESNILTWYVRFEEVLRAFLQSGGGTVFIHCQCGINRSAFLTLAYVCKNFGLDFKSVYAGTKQHRPCMYSNGVFRRQVELFIQNGRV